MPRTRYSDFKPQTLLSGEDFVTLEKAGRIKLDLQRRAVIERALQEYEFFHLLKEAGEGTALKKALLALETNTAKFISSLEAVKSEPGNIWHLLLGESGVDPLPLPVLLAKCRELNDKVKSRSGPKKDFFLDSFLMKLANVFESLERPTGVSHGARKDGAAGKGRFIAFASAALARLPERFRNPTRHSEKALAPRWDRIRKIRASRRGVPYGWIGGPYPGLTKPWVE
jgi:hypothetical protein